MRNKPTPKHARVFAHLRKRLKLSQTQLAALVGVPRHEIRNLEYGAMTLSHDTAYKVFLATGYSDDELLAGRLVQTFDPAKVSSWSEILQTRSAMLEQFERLADELLKETLASIKKATYAPTSHRALLLVELMVCLLRFRENTRLSRGEETLMWIKKRGWKRDHMPTWAFAMCMGMRGTQAPDFAEIRDSLGLK